MSTCGFAGIEPSDVNDKDILERTRQTKNAHGSIQWKYVCDDGHPIVSEWLHPDTMRKAIIIWCDVVRNTVSARARELAASKQGSKIILPPNVEDDDNGPEEEYPTHKVKKSPFVLTTEPDIEDDTDEDPYVEDDAVIRMLKAKRKKLQAKLDKLKMVIEALED